MFARIFAALALALLAPAALAPNAVAYAPAGRILDCVSAPEERLACPDLPEPQCAAVYREVGVGLARVVVPSSCSARVVVEPVTLSTGSVRPPLACAQVYEEYEAGPARIVMADSCSLALVFSSSAIALP